MSAIYLIRHGQASFGRSNYDELSELGLEQAKILGAALRPRVPEVHRAYVGTMQRHRQTAQGCLEMMHAGRGISLSPLEDKGFDEYDHEQLIARFKPRYENKLVMAAELAATLKPRQAFQEMFTQAVGRWIAGTHDADYDEPWPVFGKRCVAALERVAHALDAKQNALVFTSGGTITAIVHHMLGISNERAVKMLWTMVNCGVTKIVVGSRGVHLSSFNEHGHFEHDPKRLLTYR
ncbi:MAG: histidine phosphatase family protein [Myxococcales bacterium]